MNLDLDHMLSQTRKGQWSLDEIDWSAPLEGADALSPRQRHEAGLALLFTAGLERQAARIFRLAARFADDERARRIYTLFDADECRHAEAEIRLARRYGARWRDLPLPTRAMFHALSRDLERDDRGIHEFSAAIIVLFELALDGILIPTLRKQVRDPLQDQVFTRIDQDEARHLAMDYWLLDRKGQLFAAADAEAALDRLVGHRSLARRLLGRAQMMAGLAALLTAFAAMKLVVGDLHVRATEPETVRRYLARVSAIPRRAPAALAHPMYRSGLVGQRYVLGMLLAAAGRTPRLAAYA